MLNGVACDSEPETDRVTTDVKNGAAFTSGCVTDQEGRRLLRDVGHNRSVRCPRDDSCRPNQILAVGKRGMSFVVRSPRPADGPHLPAPSASAEEVIAAVGLEP
jgi:hypothetical protein